MTDPSNEVEESCYKPAFLSKKITFEQIQIFAIVNGIFWLGPRAYAAYTSTSLGLAAEAIQHAFDMVALSLIYFSIRAANRSNALLYPHGTGKFEAIANSVLGLSMLCSGVGLTGAGLVRLSAPAVPEQTLSGLILLVVALVINTFVYAVSKPMEKNGSKVVKFWRRAYLMDMLLKVVTIALVSLAKVTQVMAWLDAMSGIVIGGVMVYLAWITIKDSIWELSDRALEESIQLTILGSLNENFHRYEHLVDIRTRRSGGQPIIEIFLDFNDDRLWLDIQNQCSAIKQELEDRIAGATVYILPARQAPLS